MHRVGKVVKIEGNTITFELDEGVDIGELSRFSDGLQPSAEIKFDDNRVINAEQRKKIYALFGDIAIKSGHNPIEIKDWMKFYYMAEYDADYFSLANCEKSVATKFISYLIEFCFKWGIPFKDKGIHLADDVSRYLWLCLKYRVCCVCGKKADVHHCDSVGMGNNRRFVNHGERFLMAICREHHQEVGEIGQEEFDAKYLVMGIKLNDEHLVEFKITTQKNVDEHRERAETYVYEGEKGF